MLIWDIIVLFKKQNKTEAGSHNLDQDKDTDKF